MHGLIIVRSLLVRVFLLAHGLICAWRVVDINDNQYCWVILVGLGFLLIESGIVIWFRQGREFQTVAFSILFYLTCTTPSLWIIHVETANKKLYRLAENKLHTRTISSSKQDFFHFPKVFPTTTPLILSIEHIHCHDKAWEYTEDEHWLDGIQETLLIFLPLTRLCLMRDSMTNEQNLIIFLVTLINSADLLSISHSLQYHDVILERFWMYIGLIFLTINLFQMAFIDSDGWIILIKKSSKRKHEHIISFLRSVFIHDGLFFLYRTLLTVKIRCSKPSILFFMLKNLLMIIFYFYYFFENSCGIISKNSALSSYEHFFDSNSSSTTTATESKLNETLPRLPNRLTKTPRTFFNRTPPIFYPFARRRNETGDTRTAFALYGLPFRTSRILSQTSRTSLSSLLDKAFAH